MRRALAAAALAALAVVASARVEPSPRATGRRPLQEEAPAAFAFSSDERDDALPPPSYALGTNGAHAAAHAALCALEGAALEPCDEAPSPAASPASDDALNPAPPPAPAVVPPAFIYDQLLTANLVLSSTALFRRGDVLSLAGAANALNLTDAAAAASEELSRPGAPILVPNAPPTRVIVQLAAGVVQLQALASTFLAFTPEWAAAQAAFAAAEEGEEAAVAEEVAETDEVVGGRKRSRKRRSLLRRKSLLRRSRRRSLLGETGETPPNDPGGGGGGGETDDRSAETRRAALEAEAARDFRRVERRVLAGDEDENNDDDRASGGGASGASLAAYVAATLEEVRGAVGGTGGGGFGTPEVGESSGVDARLGAFEWRSGAVKSPAALGALAASGFWRAFAEGLPDDGVDVLLATLGAPARRGEEGAAAGGGGGGDGGAGASADASDDGLDDDSDVPLAARTNASSSSSGGSPFTTSSARRRETLEDVLDQLRDVEPKFDFELSVIVRPIATTLFAGVAARSWNHAALRLAPDEVTPFAYSDPLALAAVDLLPEVAVAYAESLRAANATEEEIKRKLGDAVNVRFVVTVALITRQQISVGGGDILRNIFTLEL